MDGQPYILTRTEVADGYDKLRGRSKTFRLGDIVHHLDDMGCLVLVKCTDNSPQADTDYWIMHKSNLLPFDKSLEEYLLPVKPFEDRLKLLKDAKLCQKLKDIKRTDVVYVLPEQVSSQGHVHLKTMKPALVKYKGPIPEIEPAGILFGLELLEPEDGDVNKDCVGHSGYKDYFACVPYSGLIVSANQLFLGCNASSPIPFNYKENRDDNSRLPFRVANTVAEQRANFESMSQSSYFPSRSVDHTDRIDPSKQKKPAFPPASCISKSTEDFCCGRKTKTIYPKLEMDKTISQPSRPDRLPISKKRDVCTPHEYKNGHIISPSKSEHKCLSSDQVHKKDKKTDYSFAEFPSSHSSSNFSQSGKITPVNKVNGASTHTSASLSDSIDGCKGRNIPRVAVIANSLDKPYSTTYRDDFGSNKFSKVNNKSVSNNLYSPGYSKALHSVQSDPDLNQLSNNRDNFYHRDADCPSAVSEPSEFEVGSLVEVDYGGKPRYGVIRWIGYVSETSGKKPYVGIETETEVEPDTLASDGSFSGSQRFKCHRRKGIFVNLSKCKKDKRFQEKCSSTDAASTKTFGFADCPKIEGKVRPMIVHSKDLHKICGKPKGIQGHHNSCYLDATLFSMFTFTSVFDSLLYRPYEPKDTPQYNEVQSVLRDEIVNPLRKNMFVRADKVMKLRTLLEKHSSVSGLTSEEKDPEEFLNSLVAQMLRAEPFLQLSSGQEAYYYQLFVEKDEHLEFPTVQNLFEQSFLASDIKLKEVPSVLIIQMPRFGKSFKMYPRILPSPVLDVTDVIEDSPRQCYICGHLATFECKACMKTGTGGLESISYCEGCLDRAHSHPECREKRHECKELTIPYLFEEFPDTSIPRLFMELFAVVCIETSHYVTFVKCGEGPDAPWCFFDSMADRTGEQNGYNIPEVIAVPDLPNWLSEEGKEKLQRIKDKELHEHAKRLLCDAYMCMYRSSDLQMYR